MTRPVPGDEALAARRPMDPVRAAIPGSGTCRRSRSEERGVDRRRAYTGGRM